MHRIGNEKDLSSLIWMKSNFFFLSRVKKPCGGHWRGTALQLALVILLWQISWSLMLHLQSLWCWFFSCAPFYQGAPRCPCTPSGGLLCHSAESIPLLLTIALAKIVPQGTNPKRKMFEFVCWFGFFFYPRQIVPTVDPGQSEIQKGAFGMVAFTKPLW